MIYEKPKCDCGEELIWWSQPVYTVLYDINKNGKKAKNPFDRHYELEEYPERLKCLDCDKEFEIEYDYKDRIIRSEEFI